MTDVLAAPGVTHASVTSRQPTALPEPPVSAAAAAAAAMATASTDREGECVLGQVLWRELLMTAV